MTDKQNQFVALGAEIAGIEDRLLRSHDSLSEVKRNLSFAMTDYPRERYLRAKRPVIYAGVLASAALLLAGFLLFRPGDTIHAYHGNQQISEGDWISNDTSQPTQMTFSDGSKVSIKKRGSARLQQLTDNGAHILVESGTVAASIQHNTHTDWIFSAGPYRIRVTGTRFSVSWDAARGQLFLQMYDGTVDVSGPMISSKKMVTAGETLSASLPGGRLEFVTAKGQPIPVVHARNETVVPQSNIAEPAKESAPVLKKSKPVRNHSAKTKWLVFAKSGEYDLALREAQKFGISAILKTAKAQELQLLGDSARHAGDYSIATKAYTQIRRKYRGSPSAAGATFALGIMAYHQQRDLNSAAKWFRQLLDGNGNSAGLHREALGRLIEVYQQNGQTERARQSAVRYLSKYPGGPHAKLARNVVGE